MADEAVLIITSSMIGDVILNTGAISEIIRLHAGRAVTVVCSPATEILFRHVPATVEVISLAKQKHGRHWWGLYQRLRARRWVRIYDFRNSIAGRFLSGPRVTPRLPGECPVHKVAEASSIIGNGRILPPVLWLPGADETRLPPPVLAAGPLLVLGPGASRVGKAWPIERFSAVAADLTGRGGRLEGALVVPAGGTMDTEAAAAIATVLPADRFLDMTGADLLTTGALMTRADLFVGNDSGMMHLAAAAGAPTLGLFGPTDERLYGPWGERAGSVRARHVEVVFGKTSRTVSRTETQMGALTTMEVMLAAEALLDRVAS